MSKEILLLSPPYPPEGRKRIPPLGITSIAGYLEENGYRGKIELVDGFYLAMKHGFEKSLKMVREKIKSDKPFVVGCSVLYTNEKEALEIIKTAKKVGAHVIVGSHQATASHDTYSKLVTAVVRGEGELTTKELMDALFDSLELHGIKGITFYDGEKVVVNPERKFVDLNNLPPPAFHLLQSAGEYDLMLVEESRGCCFRCTFCSIAEMYSDYRLKSAERIRLEVEKIVELDIRDVELIGELVLLHEDRALKIAEVMEEFGCGWKIDGHPALVVKHKKILPTLAKKGLKVIETGIESGNQQSLNVYNKQTTPKINAEAIQTILSAGIFPLIDFINFEPYLTMKDLEENIRFVLRYLRLLSKAPSYPLENVFKPWIPIPGTRLFKKASSENLVVTAEKGGTSISYLKMTNAQHFFQFKDEKVQKVADLIDYFLKHYGQRYYRLLEQFIKEETILSEGPKAEALAVVPAYILCMAYAVVRNDILTGEAIIDSYSQQRLDAIERGDYEKEPAIPLPAGIWEKIVSAFRQLAPSAA